MDDRPGDRSDDGFVSKKDVADAVADPVGLGFGVGAAGSMGSMVCE